MQRNHQSHCCTQASLLSGSLFNLVIRLLSNATDTFWWSNLCISSTNKIREHYLFFSAVLQYWQLIYNLICSRNNKYNYTKNNKLVRRITCIRKKEMQNQQTIWHRQNITKLQLKIVETAKSMSLVEQELYTLPEHLCSPPVFSEVRVTRSLVLCVCFVDRCQWRSCIKAV